jgi:hypothetical protein
VSWIKIPNSKDISKINLEEMLEYTKISRSVNKSTPTSTHTD